MSKLLSEEIKVINVLDPAEQTDADHTSDVVNLADFKRCTFYVITGASAASIPMITVLAGISKSSCSQAIPFNYRTQKDQDTQDALSDVTSALTKLSATTGVKLTTAIKGQVFIAEVDVRELVEANSLFNHVCLKLAADGATHAVHNYCIIAILSQPRYDTLKTAID